MVEKAVYNPALPGVANLEDAKRINVIPEDRRTTDERAGSAILIRWGEETRLPSAHRGADPRRRQECSGSISMTAAGWRYPRLSTLHLTVGYIPGIDPTEVSPHIVLSDDSRLNPEPCMRIGAEHGPVQIPEQSKRVARDCPFPEDGRVVSIDHKPSSVDHIQYETRRSALVERARWIKRAKLMGPSDLNPEGGPDGNLQLYRNDCELYGVGDRCL